MKHLLIIFFLIFAASRVHAADVSKNNRYNLARKGIMVANNTYSKLLQETVVNSTILLSYYSEKINEKTYDIVSETMETINDHISKWEDGRKKVFLQKFAGINATECLNFSSVYNDYASELLNRTINCTIYYSQNITKNIQYFNDTVRLITEDGSVKIRAIKAEVEKCFDEHRSELDIFSCTHHHLGKYPKFPSHPEYQDAEMKLAAAAEEFATNIYSCKLSQDDKKRVETQFGRYVNNFEWCVNKIMVEKLKKF